jgi:hypothetical protein
VATYDLLITVGHDHGIIAATLPSFIGSLNIIARVFFDEMYPLLASYAIRYCEP